MSVKLLNEHNLESLSLKGGYASSSESILVKILQCHGSYTTDYPKFIESSQKEESISIQRVNGSSQQNKINQKGLLGQK